MRAAVLGSPVAHSLSPVLHNAAYAALGLDGWSYGRHECREAELPAFLDGLGPEWAGLSLTMPLKRVALTVADAVDPPAAAVGAANTLVPGERWTAHNTDVIGIATALASTTARADTTEQATVGVATAGVTTAGMTTAGSVARADATGRAVVLGAGGTAQSALAALHELGIDDLTVLVRDLGRTGELRATAARLGVSPEIDDALTDPTRTSAVLTAADVVISTLPAGAADALTPPGAGSTVFDVVYAPWPTAFAAAALTRGARVVSGLEMLLHQAVAQVELMTGKPGPVGAMRTALDAAVADRG